MQLENSHVLLTGGRGGLGTALAESLRRRGACVTTAGRDDGEDIKLDMSDRRAVDRFCENLSGTPVDILINNAGLQYFGRMQDQPRALLRSMLAVNLETPLMLSRAVLPGMLARGRGQIVNIGSVFADIPFPYFGVYTATKGGMRAFSQSLRREFSGKGVGVTYIAPRALQTPMSAGPVFELLRRTRSAMDPPAKAAEQIIDAVENDRKDIYIGFREKIFAAINGLSPSLLDRGLKRSRNIGDEILASQLK